VSYPVNVVDQNNQSYSIQVDELPTECPICKSGIKPIPLNGHFFNSSPHKLRIPFICPVDHCHEMFIGKYNVVNNNVTANVNRLTRIVDTRIVDNVSFPEAVNSISALFAKIYNQSHIAEENNLDQIAGPGYRKALEYLIKDFLVNYKFKEDKKKIEAVKKTHLAPCISNFIEDSRIKQCAERATWLGNDETHYIRKWNENDIEDLKNLISITVSWINLTMQSDHYLACMPKGKK